MKTSEVTSIIRGCSANKGGQSLENEERFFYRGLKDFQLTFKDYSG